MKHIEQFVRNKLPEFAVNHVLLVIEKASWLCLFYPFANKHIIESASWLHDIAQVSFNEQYYTTPEQHHIDGAKIAEKYLKSIGEQEIDIQRIVQCIIEHRTRRPPDPSTIESQIVASADKLSHIIAFDNIVLRFGKDHTLAKMRRDLNLKWLLPEAKDEFQRLIEKRAWKRYEKFAFRTYSQQSKDVFT